MEVIALLAAILGQAGLVWYRLGRLENQVKTAQDDVKAMRDTFQHFLGGGSKAEAQDAEHDREL